MPQSFPNLWVPWLARPFLVSVMGLLASVQGVGWGMFDTSLADTSCLEVRVDQLSIGSNKSDPVTWIPWLFLNLFNFSVYASFILAFVAFFFTFFLLVDLMLPITVISSESSPSKAFLLISSFSNFSLTSAATSFKLGKSTLIFVTSSPLSSLTRPNLTDSALNFLVLKVIPAVSCRKRVVADMLLAESLQ